MHICPNQGLFCARFAQPAFLCIKRREVRQTRLSSILCVRLHPSAGWLQESPYRRFLLPPAFHFAGAVEHDLFKLRVLGSPQTIPLCQQLRRNGQTIREPEQLPIGRPPIPCNRTPVTWQENSLFLHTGHPVIFLILLRLHGYRERKTQQPCGFLRCNCSVTESVT